MPFKKGINLAVSLCLFASITCEKETLMKKYFLGLILICITGQGFAENKLKMREGMSPEVEATYKDIKKTLGILPTFLKTYPQNGVSGAWEEMKTLQLNNQTAIPGKYKELIGLAVAAQIPCQYCIYFHGEAAKLNQASDKEIKEAIAVAALSRHWSTWFNGMMLDEAVFKNDVSKMMSYARSQMNPTTKKEVEQIKVVTSNNVYKDIENTVGHVPEFMKQFPSVAMVGAWLNAKAVLLEQTAIPAKYKDLISIAVGAQIPCHYCLIIDKEAAKVDGATDTEIKEAIAMAALTRHWSTFLNGTQIPETLFKKEAQQIFRHMRSMSKQPGSVAKVIVTD